MALDGTMLLRHLEPAVRPVGSLAERSSVDIEQWSFEDLLNGARRGGLASGRFVDSKALQTPLDSEALDRLGRALDLLETRGAGRAILLYGSRALLAEVPARRFLPELVAQEPLDPVEVDLAVRVATPDEEGPRQVPGPPTALVMRRPVELRLAARDSQGNTQSLGGSGSPGA